MTQVIFVDDDADVRAAYGQALELAGYQVTLCRALIEAVDHLSTALDGVVISDMRMPGRDGFDMLARCREIDPDLPVIILTGEGDVPMAVQALSEGAFDFLEKPCPPKRLIDVIEAAAKLRRLVLENRALKTQRLLRDDPNLGLAEQMELVERRLIVEALEASNGRVAQVAERLRLPRKTLYDKLKKHGIDPASYR
jgi:two-component system C4-dicarboxylate transport response regulator DctD